MNATIPGLITVAGLISTACYLSGHDKRVFESFTYFFCTFCSVNAAFHLSVDRETYQLMYSVPAIPAAAMTIYTFQKYWDIRVFVFAGIYVLVILGMWSEIDTYKLYEVDILDILVWCQLGLLIHLAKKAPSRAPGNGRSCRTRF